MIGRAAIGNPWLFENLKSLLETGEPSSPPSVEERWDYVLRYAEIMREHYSHLRTDMILGIMKGRLVSFVAGFPGARKLRNRISRLQRFEEIHELRDESLKALRELETSTT